MFEEICKNDLCTGCSACAQSCPKFCIKMQPDKDGFLRPVIDENLCITCGKCKKICPVNHPPKDDNVIPQAFAAKYLNDAVREASSSGGIFSALAEKVLQYGGAVIGAGFDAEFNVVHKVCTESIFLDELRRSKYVQSNVNEMFLEAFKRLENGQIVLFCGTPCQIGGLKAFLEKEYANLYLVDFVCHGVPSPKVWKKYLSFREQDAGEKIQHVNFRSKISGWCNYSMLMEFSNEKKYIGNVREDLYLRSFVMNMDLRPSCNQCMFKQVHRQADLTLADFWGIKDIEPSLDDDKGVSLVLLNTDKGRKLFESLESVLSTKAVDYKTAIQKNPSITKSVLRPPLRDQFMKQLDGTDFKTLHDKFCGTGAFSRLRRKIAEIRCRMRKNG